MSTLETQKTLIEENPLDFIRTVVESADQEDARQAAAELAALDPARSIQAAYEFAQGFYPDRTVYIGDLALFGTRNKSNQAIDVTYGKSKTSLFIGTHLKTPVGWSDARDSGKESSYLFTLSGDKVGARRLFVDGTIYAEHTPYEIAVSPLEQKAALHAFFLSTVAAGIASAQRPQEQKMAASSHAKELTQHLVDGNQKLDILPFWVPAELVQVNAPRKIIGL